MPWIADLHIHSLFSRATSREMNLEGISRWARWKGIKLVGTGDFTHPEWLKHLKQGLKRDDAMAIMRGLFDGFGTLIQNVHPALLKDGVMSPGGTTAAGYGALEDGNVRSACIDAIERAYKRATEL